MTTLRRDRLPINPRSHLMVRVAAGETVLESVFHIMELVHSAEPACGRAPWHGPRRHSEGCAT